MFKFDEYPKIKECHEKYEALSDAAYEASFNCDRCGISEKEKNMKKYLEIEDKVTNFKFEIYARVIFETFNPIKPVLRNVWKCNKESTWGEMVGDEFKKGDEDQGSLLVGLVESEDPYILPAEYYTGKTRVGIYLEKGDF